MIISTLNQILYNNTEIREKQEVDLEDYLLNEPIISRRHTMSLFCGCWTIM